MGRWESFRTGGWTGRPLAKKPDSVDQSWESIAASGFRIEIAELPNLPGVFANRLQVPMFDKHGREALLVLDFHAVENAAIGIDADKELLGRFEIT